ncbi:MAG: damage-control phosphatase ARMT1 family protein [Chloroflexota bacterium]|nr:damage-control phosphatase ARMT1 family protein [Chloroflexota bacterium]
MTPSPLMTSEPGSFARKTILERKPAIIRQVLSDHDYPPEIVSALRAFRDEIASEPVRTLIEDAPDVAGWQAVWAEFEGHTWLDVPWYFAEAYFYRRLLEAVRYFQSGPWWLHDPFAPGKAIQLAEAIGPTGLAAEALSQLRDEAARLEAWLHASLWGNRADLSNLTVTDEVRERQALVERENLLIDHVPQVRELLRRGTFPHVAFINDNTGLELGFDLCLADCLLAHGWAERVTFHLKRYPFFVSDAMIKDVRAMVEAFAGAKRPPLRELGARLQAALAQGKLMLIDDPFWTTALHFPQMGPRLREALRATDLVISKGDVNYRRLLSDRQWPFTTPTEEVLDYFPTSLLILRTLKGEILTGVEEGVAERIGAEDPDWLLNGQRGLIQLIK